MTATDVDFATKLPNDVLRTIAILARRAYERERWPYYGLAGELRTTPPNAAPIGINIMGNEVRYKFPFALPPRFTDYIVYALGKDDEHITQFYLYEGPSALIATAWYDIIEPESGCLYMHISYKNAQRPLIGLLTILQRYLPKHVIDAADIQLCYNDITTDNTVRTVMQRPTIRDYLSAPRTACDREFLVVQ